MLNRNSESTENKERLNVSTKRYKLFKTYICKHLKIDKCCHTLEMFCCRELISDLE